MTDQPTEQKEGQTPGPTDRKAERERAFYAAWDDVLSWMREYAASREEAIFEKEADFPDYIYRMERPYELPTTVMSASLSRPDGHPVLMVNASPRHAVFKEIVVHPFESHVYRKLTYTPSKESLTEGKRPFTKERLFDLADSLFEVDASAE